MTPKTIQRELKVDSKTYMKYHLQLVNVILNLDLTEVEINLIAFIRENENVIDYEKATIELQIPLNILQILIKVLIDKSIITVNELGIYAIHEMLFPQEDIQQYQIKLVNNDITK